MASLWPIASLQPGKRDASTLRFVRLRPAAKGMPDAGYVSRFCPALEQELPVRIFPLPTAEELLQALALISQTDSDKAGIRPQSA